MPKENSGVFIHLQRTVAYEDLSEQDQGFEALEEVPGMYFEVPEQYANTSGLPLAWFHMSYSIEELDNFEIEVVRPANQEEDPLSVTIPVMDDELDGYIQLVSKLRNMEVCSDFYENETLECLENFLHEIGEKARQQANAQIG